MNGRGSYTFVCRGRRSQPKCRWCSKTAVAVCDAPLLAYDPAAPATSLRAKSSKTCDAPMCGEHRHRVSSELDACPNHRATWPAGLIELELPAAARSAVWPPKKRWSMMSERERYEATKRGDPI